MSSQHSDRRRHKRYELRLPVYLDREDGTTFPATLQDISQGGMLMKTEQLPPIGSGIGVEFRVLPNLQCQAYGRVLRHEPGGIAVQFLWVDASFLQFIRDLEALAFEDQSGFLAS